MRDIGNPRHRIHDHLERNHHGKHKQIIECTCVPILHARNEPRRHGRKQDNQDNRSDGDEQGAPKRGKKVDFVGTFDVILEADKRFCLNAARAQVFLLKRRKCKRLIGNKELSLKGVHKDDQNRDDEHAGKQNQDNCQDRIDRCFLLTHQFSTSF